MKLKHLKHLATLLAVLWALSLHCAKLAAQTQTTGDVAGVVTDASGAVVPDAKVVLKSNDRGSSQDVTTSKDGVYRFFLLAPGSYTVIVSAAGFQTSQQVVQINLGQIATADVHLSVGSSNTTVTVSEEAPLVESENGNVSSTLSEKQIQEMPNSGNDITFNAQLAAGSVSNTAGGGLGNFSSFGISATANLFTLNGMDDNDPFLSLNNSGATNLTLGNNEVQEVSVTTNGYSGEYGTLAGANVAFVTKSGTNEWHGKDSYYWNGRALNANSWFNNADGLPRSFVNANQWGADIGGPIVKNKVFGYFNTEGLYLFIPAGGETISIPSPQFAAATHDARNTLRQHSHGSRQQYDARLARRRPRGLEHREQRSNVHAHPERTRIASFDHRSDQPHFQRAERSARIPRPISMDSRVRRQRGQSVHWLRSVVLGRI
jgi:hypothetical protein